MTSVAEILKSKPEAKVHSVAPSDTVLTALKLMADKRIGAGWEQVPTLKERQIDLSIGGWRGLAAPRGTPPEVVATLRTAMARTLQEPALRDTMAKQNMGEGYLDAPEFKALIARDNAFFKQLIERLNIRV